MGILPCPEADIGDRNFPAPKILCGFPRKVFPFRWVERLTVLHLVEAAFGYCLRNSPFTDCQHRFLFFRGQIFFSLEVAKLEGMAVEVAECLWQCGLSSASTMELPRVHPQYRSISNRCLKKGENRYRGSRYWPGFAAASTPCQGRKFKRGTSHCRFR